MVPYWLFGIWNLACIGDNRGKRERDLGRFGDFAKGEL